MRPSNRALFPTFLLPTMPFRRRKSSTDSSGGSSTLSSPPLSPTSNISTSPSSLMSPSDHLKDRDTATETETTSVFLGRHVSYLRCARCAVDLCLTSAIVSRGFTGRWGRAYLVSAAGCLEDPNLSPSNRPLPNALPNTTVHRPVPRQLVTGAHTVSDVSCAFCGSVLGWKYVAADEESQRYKVGKFILETKRVCVVADWEQGGYEDEDMEVDDGYSPGHHPSAHHPTHRHPHAYHTKDTHLDAGDEFDSQDEEECEELFQGVWSAGGAATRRARRRFGREGV